MKASFPGISRSDFLLVWHGAGIGGILVGEMQGRAEGRFAPCVGYSLWLNFQGNFLGSLPKNDSLSICKYFRKIVELGLYLLFTFQQKI